MIDITRVRVKVALGDAACALCRLRFKAKERFLPPLLLNKMSERELHLHLARSVGFYPTHMGPAQG